MTGRTVSIGLVVTLAASLLVVGVSAQPTPWVVTSSKPWNIAPTVGPLELLEIDNTSGRAITMTCRLPDGKDSSEYTIEGGAKVRVLGNRNLITLRISSGTATGTVARIPLPPLSWSTAAGDPVFLFCTGRESVTFTVTNNGPAKVRVTIKTLMDPDAPVVITGPSLIPGDPGKRMTASTGYRFAKLIIESESAALQATGILTCP